MLVTRKADEKAKLRFKDMFAVVHEIAPDTLLDAVVKIRDIAAQYQRIVLHIHFDDIAAVIACALVKQRRHSKVYFLNHADHAFTYGSSVADYYFQLSSFGARLDLKKQIMGQTSFLGIPIADVKPENRAETTALNPALHFFSSGSAMKFRPFRGANMSPLITRLLNEAPNSTFTLVGINFAGNVWLWPSSFVLERGCRYCASCLMTSLLHVRVKPISMSTATLSRAVRLLPSRFWPAREGLV